jgi:hypothetical protein
MDIEPGSVKDAQARRGLDNNLESQQALNRLCRKNQTKPVVTYICKDVIATPQIDRTQYKHIRDLSGKLVATVCILSLSCGNKAIGISVCSPLDNFSRRIGREKAFLRAKQAADTRTTSCPVRNNKKKLAENPALAAIGMIYKYLSIYIPANRSYWKVII